MRPISSNKKVGNLCSVHARGLGKLIPFSEFVYKMIRNSTYFEKTYY
jgi:hypothetical protein